MERPASAEELARVLAAARSVRPVGGDTKPGWGGIAAVETELSTAGLNEIVEHNEGDLTTVLQAGVGLAAAQERFAGAGQRLALDPPDGGATIGGVLATGDSGPLRHRHGAVRDLVLGVQVALPDGSLARAGSRVIKNVAGYDLAKLMCGALGTLGIVTEITLRLHPRPRRTLTAVGSGSGAAALAAAAGTLARRPLELEALDCRWDGPRGGGAILARAGGEAAQTQVERAGALLGAAGLEVQVVERDEELWEAQRARQRAQPGSAIVRVSTLPAELERVLEASDRAVARAALGLVWVQIPAESEALERLRALLPGRACVLVDAPASMRAAVDPWGALSSPGLELMRRVKLRFDPDGVCNPGFYVGGL